MLLADPSIGLGISLMDLKAASGGFKRAKGNVQQTRAHIQEIRADLKKLGILGRSADQKLDTVEKSFSMSDVSVDNIEQITEGVRDFSDLAVQAERWLLSWKGALAVSALILSPFAVGWFTHKALGKKKA